MIISATIVTATIRNRSTHKTQKSQKKKKKNTENETAVMSDSVLQRYCNLLKGRDSEERPSDTCVILQKP